MARRDRERQDAARYAEWREQVESESSEAEAARWANRWAQQARETRPEVYPDSPGIDRRLYDVDGYTPAAGQ